MTRARTCFTFKRVNAEDNDANRFPATRSAYLTFMCVYNVSARSFAYSFAKAIYN